MYPQDIPLRDIHIPNPVSWWPLAPGWWALFVVVMIVIALAGAYVWWRKRHCIRRAAIREFILIEKHFAEHLDTHRLARELSQLARRTALAYTPTSGTAALIGPDWIAHLESLNEAAHNTASVMESLALAAYRPDASFDADVVLDTCREWFSNLHEPRTVGQ